MSTSKHDKGESPFRDDLERNPGIGQSKGSFATGIDRSDSTAEGDIENDAPANGGASERQLGRTNA
jgi:hypothetical protein